MSENENENVPGAGESEDQAAFEALLKGAGIDPAEAAAAETAATVLGVMDRVVAGLSMALMLSEQKLRKIVDEDGLGSAEAADEALFVASMRGAVGGLKITRRAIEKALSGESDGDGDGPIMFREDDFDSGF